MRRRQISGLLTRANGQQRCVFSLDLLMQTMCDVTEKLVLLYYCGRISKTCRISTSVVPLLSCLCTCLNSPFFSFLLFPFFSSEDLTRPDRNFCCHDPAWTLSACAGHPELSPVSSDYANCKPAGTDSCPAFPLRPGRTSLFVFFQALCLHFKRCCCIIHSWGETAAPRDWQVMCEMLWSLTGGWRANPG